jgi:hypothetical protein
MVKVSSRLACVVLASTVGLMGVIGGAACTDTNSATNLYTIGPPMIEQVRLRETFIDQFNNSSDRVVFAFGTNPEASTDEEHAVTSALAVSNHLRVIMDHLLLGNNLEEIACRGIIDEDSYSRVPESATPDDIAKCATPRDVLPQTCAGPNAVCICNLPAGCAAEGAVVAMGAPVGVLDTNQDGAADDTRFIDGSVGIQCGTIKVPISLDESYWNPSGDQQEPAKGGFDALGPAIVLTPAGALPTNSTCGLQFDPSVVDKVHVGVCTPPDGDVTKGCSPPDVSAFSFKVQPLTLQVQVITDGDVGVSRTDTITAATNAPLDPASISSIVMLEGAAPYTTVNITQMTTAVNTVIQIQSTAAGGLAPNTMYTITFPGGATGIRDAFEVPLPAPVTIHFTTGA